MQFGYDIWANLFSATVTKCSAPPLGLTINTLNRIADPGFSYDAAGNLIAEPQKTYTYDAENRMTQSVVSGVTATYVYDGDGKRVKKGTAKLYWNGTGADPLEESNGSGTPSADFIFFNGKRTARLDLPGAAVHYYFANHLGSTSIVTSDLGVIQDESDYYPFGGERAVTDTDPNQYKFTGKERDTESNLDFFIARYYSAGYGRFSSADPENAGSDIGDPQSWNGYAYVRDNPLNLIDPTGREFCRVIHDRKGNPQAVGCVSDEKYRKDPSKYEDYKYVVIEEPPLNEDAQKILGAVGQMPILKFATVVYGAGAAIGVAGGVVSFSITSSQPFVLAQFVGLEGHHPIAQFLGGNLRQLLSSIPRYVHRQLHMLLKAELEKAGFVRPIGGVTGSTIEWLNDMLQNPGAQSRAFDVLLRVTQTIDAKFGTQITKDLIQNLAQGNYKPMP